MERIVYLFGAGATIAEAQYMGIDKDLSLRSVSEMVIKEAKNRPDTRDLLEYVSTDDITDIELVRRGVEEKELLAWREQKGAGS